ncbi:MAG: IS110 family transposase [Terracidiphilus sp.]|jgi:transposase
MDVVVACCAGLDVHQASVVACVNSTGRGGRSHKEVRTFGTMRDDLIALRDWLKHAGVTQVVMESTGVYWKPVYAALEDDFDTIVANAQHIKNVPGRKTDVKDCEWSSDLLRHGLIRRGFVPPREIRDLRELNRYRRKLAQVQAGERNRLIKVLETAGIKLAGVASDVFGVSGRAMLRALIEGEDTPEAMAGLARGKLRGKRTPLARALDAPLQPHQRFILRTQLARIEQAETDLQRLDTTLKQMIAPYDRQMRLLMSIPGVDWITAVTIIAEIGVDMSAFVSAAHLASWAGLCPGNNESAGKRRSGKSRKGNVFLKTALITAAITGSRRGGGSYLGEKYRRLSARRGKLRAAVAIAHKILISIWHMLSDGTFYQDLGAAYFDRLDRTRTARKLVGRLAAMGFDVQLQEKAA